MASFRKLPSGRHQAIVRGPDGKRHTTSDPLKSVVREWAATEEAKIAKGRWRHPRAGRITIAEWAERWFAARVVEPQTRRGDQGILKNHILPHWENWKLLDIAPSDVQKWVRLMERNHVGAPTIRRAYNLFKTILDTADTDGLIGETPCRKIKRPATPDKTPAWFTRDHIDRIQQQLRTGVGKRPKPHHGHATMVELMVCSGPRWGEAAALRGQERDDGVGNPVDWLRGRARIVGTLSQEGEWKPHPKTSKSRREIPIPAHVLAAMSELLTGRDRDSWVFITNRGNRTLRGANWRVVWYAALDAANEQITRENRALPRNQHIPPIPRLDPHDCRHTCASWLVQSGVPLYEVQRLLGHESSQTTERYAHLAPDRHDPIEQAWKNILAHVRRTDDARGGESHG